VNKSLLALRAQLPLAPQAGRSFELLNYYQLLDRRTAAEPRQPEALRAHSAAGARGNTHPGSMTSSLGWAPPEEAAFGVLRNPSLERKPAFAPLAAQLAEFVAD
jgi:hypothetical protein